MHASPFARVAPSDVGPPPRFHIREVDADEYYDGEGDFHEPGERSPLPSAFWARWSALDRAGGVTVWGALVEPSRHDPDPPRFPALVRVAIGGFYEVSVRRGSLPPLLSVNDIESLFVALANELDAALKRPEVT